MILVAGLRLGRTITRDMTKGCELLADVSCINRRADAEGSIFEANRSRQSGDLSPILATED
jgi:hypothetical protein